MHTYTSLRSRSLRRHVYVYQQSQCFEGDVLSTQSFYHKGYLHERSNKSTSPTLPRRIAQLDGAHLGEADFRGADLSGGSLSRTSLRETDFS